MTLTRKTPANSSPSSSASHRLPTNISPIHYQLTFELPISANDSRNFKGSAQVQLLVIQTTNAIVLNSKALVINSVVFVHNDEESLLKLVPLTTTADPDQETCTFKFEQPFAEGTMGTLHLEFTGEVNDSLHGGLNGLFRTKCSNNSQDEEEHYNYVTFFCPIAARSTFPCWDEPGIKATFSLSLKIPEKLIGISNMPIESETLSFEAARGVKKLVFQTTPKMSTYLLGFLVGQFDYIEQYVQYGGDKSGNKDPDPGVLVRVYTPICKQDSGSFALEVATKCLGFYTEYFGIPYPLPKLDLVPINGFPCGGMENWGIITFLESLLLVDPIKTSTYNKQRVALVVAHEIAHMWFGDLVTMTWWGEIWLNEAFATFMQYLSISMLYPEFDVWSQFITDNLQVALELDSFTSSHPIEMSVGHPSEIDEVFDIISYKKGASLIKMLVDYIGDDGFKAGMQHYLNKYSYGNASTEDLWAALEQANPGKPIKELMDTWTKQMGYPLINISQEGDGRVVRFTQCKFVSSSSTSAPAASDLDDTTSKYKWLIPLQLVLNDSNRVIHSNVFDATKSKEYEFIFILPLEEGVEEEGKTKDWIRVCKEFGFYRVKYPKDILTRFMTEGNNLCLSDKLGFLDDLFALAANGQESTAMVLNILESFRHETHYTIWSTICDFLSKLDQLLYGRDFYDESFRYFALYLLGPIGEKLGWEEKDDESHLDTLLRALILAQLVKYEHEPTLKEARGRFDLHVAETVRVWESGEGPSKMKYVLPADFRQLIYTSALMEANDVVFNCALEHAGGSDLLEEKLRILRSVASMKNLQLLEQYLNYAITEPGITNSELVEIIIAVSRHKIGRDLAWEFFKSHAALFQERFQGGMMLCSLVKYLTIHFTAADKVSEIQEFFGRFQFRGVQRTIEQSIENIQISVEWLGRDVVEIKEYLSSKDFKV